MNRVKSLVLLVMVAIIDAQFNNNPPDVEFKCSGETVYFNWTYAISSPVLFVEWKVSGSRIAIESVASSQPFSPVSAYIGRLSKITNAQISLGPLTIADSGTYKAEVTYTNGNAGDSNQISLNVYDELNNQTEIVKTPGDGMVTLKPSFYDSSITYTWKLQGKVISTGSFYDAKLDGNYTLCISGGRANCLNPTISSCDSIEVSGLNGCNYSAIELFLGGFSCFLIVVITTITMLIILGCKILPEIFGDLSTKKKTIKIIIIVVFIVVALIIGLALGFGLKECNQRNLGLGLGLGLGFLLAIALVVTLFIYHKQCDFKKENEDENRFSLDSCFRKCQVKPEKEMESPTEIQSKTPEDNHKRVGNKTDVLKGDQSALNQKVLHSPLPVPPLVNSQPPTASDDNSPVSRKKLDPIAVENEEANSSEKKKKKKKRKKKKNVDEAGNIGDEN